MNYKFHYDLLIERAKNREIKGITEKHHIVPRCMGGINEETNLVRLTPEEHYVAHQLLVKIFPDVQKLVFAVFMMTYDSNGNRMNNKLFGWIRKKLGNTISIINTKNAKERTRKSGLTQRGKKLSDSHKAKLVEAGKRRIQTRETKLKMSFTALNRSEEEKQLRTISKQKPEYKEKMRTISQNKRWMIYPPTLQTSFVSTELVDKHLFQGWKFGRTTT